jgi:hypothetical protein
MNHRASSLNLLPTQTSNKGLGKGLTFVRPDENKHKRRLLWLAFSLMMFAVILGPASAVLMAQSSASAPVFNATVQGQSASTVEGTFANVVNYIGNVLCPIGSALAVVATVIQAKSGRSWAPSAITAGALLAVSGITRLIESMVTNGQSAVQ